MSWTEPVFTNYRHRLAELEKSDSPYSRGIAWTGGPDYLPLSEAKVPLLDQGFMKSDLTYDVPAVWDGRFFRLEDHLDRFEQSLAKLRLINPLGRQGLRDKLIEMVATSGIRDAYVMMIVTRGMRYIRQTPPQECQNNCYLLAMPYMWVMEEKIQERGGSAIIARTVRRIPTGAIDPTVKNLQWGDFTRGILEARDRGAEYPILSDGDGNLTEGSGFNVMLIKDGKIFTPKRGVLEGVTRKSVLSVADKLGIPWMIGDVPIDMAYKADEIMFVTTAGGVMPVTQLDGDPIGDGYVGPLTRVLWHGYWEAHYDPDISLPLNYY